jgi:hypothetical protein
MGMLGFLCETKETKPQNPEGETSMVSSLPGAGVEERELG